MNHTVAQPVGALPSWSLQDAKARFSELVRVAGEHGPQLVTLRGEPTAVILSIDEYDRLVCPERGTSLWDAIQGWKAIDDDQAAAQDALFESIRSPVRPIAEFED